MIKINNRTRVILGVFLILYSLIQSYRLLTIWYDLQASFLNSSFLNTSRLEKSEPDLSAAAASGANPMTLIDEIMPAVASDTYGQMLNLANDYRKGGKAFFAADEDIEAWLANVPDLETKSQTLCERMTQLLASFPVAAPERPEKKCYSSVSSLYMPVRYSARFYALLTWHLARQGNTQQALLTACAPAAVGALLEIYDTHGGALTYSGFTMGEAKAQLTGSLLRELAPMLKGTREDAIKVLKWAEILEKALPSPAPMLANEINFWPGFASNLQKAIDNGEAMKSVGRNPHALVSLFSDQAQIDSYLVPIMSAFRQVCAEPYPQALKRLAEVHELAHPLKKYKASAGLHYLKFFFMPDTAFTEMLLGTMMPDLDEIYISSIKTKAMLRGGALAVALHAYHNENGSWPTDLAEVANWLGVPSLPQDPFAATTWAYSAAEPSLLSPGPDLKTGTSDDLQFLRAPR